MSIDHHTATHKRPSFADALIGWVKAKFADVMVVAEVLHHIQRSAPWDQPSK